jgi:hypothetical protein
MTELGGHPAQPLRSRIQDRIFNVGQLTLVAAVEIIGDIQLFDLPPERPRS